MGVVVTGQYIYIQPKRRPPQRNSPVKLLLVFFFFTKPPLSNPTAHLQNYIPFFFTLISDPPPNYPLITRGLSFTNSLVVASIFSSPMAVAFGFATSIAPSTPSNPNLRPLVVSCPQLQTFYKPLNNGRASAFNQSLRVRCESVSQNLNTIDKEELKRSSAMALAQLKASAIDRYTKEKSSLIVIGLNVHTAPVDVREKLAIQEAQWPQAIRELCALNHIEEAAVLSTCNRMEVYVVALSQHRGVKEVTEWMSKISGVSVSELCQHRFMLYNKDATRHLFEVASGLNSIVLGEGQILAQVKQVKKLGQGVDGFNKKIGGLFEHAIITGKRVRTETNISSGSVSVSSAAVELALMKLPESSYATTRVLVIGAGKMGKLVIKHLAAKGCKEMVVVNRTEEKVAVIREELKDIQIIYKPLSEMMACAAEADVIFTSTASDTPLFLKEHAQTLPVDTEMGRRLFIDISVPRNVGPCVSDLETAEVYNVDDLKDIVAANKEDRLRKAMEAQIIISEELQHFEAWKDSLEAVPTIKKLRAYLERIRASELDKCLSKMGDITDKQKKAIYDLSMGMMKKFLHGPMQHLRCDGRSDCQRPEEMLEIMHAVNRMFDLETEIILDTVRTKMERIKK